MNLKLQLITGGVLLYTVMATAWLCYIGLHSN